MKLTKKLGIAAAAVAAAGVIGGGLVATAAYADTTTSPTPAPSRSAQSSPESTTGTGQGGHSGRQGAGHTEVTGAEADKVIAAVKAKDSSLTVTKVLKDADGSYDAVATKADGSTVRMEVSADLSSVTESAGRSGKGGRGTSSGTEVTGAEADKVSAAVKAGDSSLTVTKVLKAADGSYFVLADKADGTKVRYKVSADLSSITESAARNGGASSDTPVTGAEADKVTAAVTAKDAAVKVESVRKDPDGSYDVSGTKDGAKVWVEVSADLQTVTVTSHR